MTAKHKKGAVTVEFILVTLFILLPLLFGTFDLAIAIYNKQVITNASREGARAGIMRSAIAVETVVESYCQDKLILNGPSPTCTVTGGGAFQNDLTVNVSFVHNFFFTGIIGLRNVTLTGRTVMKMEQIPSSGS